MKTIYKLRTERERQEAHEAIDAIDLLKHQDFIIRLKKESKLERMRKSFHGKWLPQIIQSRIETHGIYLTNHAYKDHFKQMFLCYEDYKTVDGALKSEIISTEKLNTKEYSEFMEKVDYYCATEWGIQLMEFDPEKREMA